ncbi:hypothetical protein CCP3SC15_1240007 [Gammaproteobacteria bacterium]
MPRPIRCPKGVASVHTVQVLSDSDMEAEWQRITQGTERRRGTSRREQLWMPTQEMVVRERERKYKRSDKLKTASVVQEWAAYLSGVGFDTYVTVTWSDGAADKFHVDGARSAMREFRRFMAEMGIKKWYAVVEGHKERAVPHIHAVVKYGGRRTVMWQKWWGETNSMARILPITDGCFSYVSKYILKDGGDTGGFTTEWRI